MYCVTFEPMPMEFFNLQRLADDNPNRPYIRNDEGPGFSPAKPGSMRAAKIAAKRAKARAARAADLSRRKMH